MKRKTVLLVAIVLLCLFQTVRAYPIKETVFASGMDLLFIDSFNRYTGAESPYRQMLFDVSPWENHGYVYPNNESSTTYGGPSLVWGKHGKALSFDGTDDWVDIPNADILRPAITTSSTVSMWIYARNVTDYECLISKQDKQYSIFVMANSSIRFGVSYLSTWYYTYSDAIDARTWYYVTLVHDYDLSQLRGYINAELVGTTGGIGSLDTDTYDLNIATSGQGGAFWFDGIIDEVRIYNLALTTEEIYNDMLTPIAEFRKYLFIASKIYNGAWSTGFISGITGINDNDIDLPWVYSSNATGYHLFIDKYIPGFQSFRAYCTLENSGGANTQYSYVKWVMAFFKDGEIQAEYSVKMRNHINASSRTWYIEFKHNLPGSADTRKMVTFVYASDTAANEAPLVCDIWVGPDSKHVSMRVVAENRTTAEPHSWSYSFDLSDRSGNVMPIGVFDGWARLTYEVYIPGNGRFEIASHKGLWETVSGFFEKIVASISGATNTVVTAIEPVIKPVTEIFEPVIQQISDAGDPLGAMIQNAIGSLEHGLYGAVGNLGKTMSDSLGGLNEGLQAIGNVFVQSLLNFADALMTAFEPFTDSIYNAFSGVGTLVYSAFGGIGTLVYNAFSGIGSVIWNAWIGLVDEFWTAFSGLFDAFLDFMDTIFAWTGHDTLFTDFATFLNDNLLPSLADALLDLPDMFNNFFNLLGVTFARGSDTVTTIVNGGIDFFNALWVVLETGYGGAISIADFIEPFLPLAFIFYVIYLVYLFDDQGLEGLLNHVKMVLDIAHFIVNMLITVIQTIINFVDQLIEAIPVVE